MSLRTLVLFSFLFTLPVAEADSRIQVDFPPMMQEHMMGNMRDHLLALQTITQQLSAQQYDVARSCDALCGKLL